MPAVKLGLQITKMEQKKGASMYRKPNRAEFEQFIVESLYIAKSYFHVIVVGDLMAFRPNGRQVREIYILNKRFVTRDNP